MPEQDIAPRQTPRRGREVREPDQSGDTAVSDELVRKITDKVYRMLLDDLALERERQRPPSGRGISHRGGW